MPGSKGPGIIIRKGGNKMSNYQNMFEAIAVSSVLMIYVVIIGVALFISLAITVFLVIVNWKILQKAGVEGWKALIPFYGFYCMADISVTQPTSLICFLAYTIGLLLVCIPYVGPVLFSMIGNAAYGIVNYSLAKSFGRDTGICILAIFFPIVIRPMIAFSNDVEYTGDKVKIF